MSVRALLKRKPSKVITVDADHDLAHAARLLMKHNVGGLPVLDRKGAPVGFIAEREIVRAVDGHPDGVRGLPVKAVMRTPAPTCGADDGLQDVMRRITRERVRHLLVLDGEDLAGVISVGDLVKHRLEQLETEAGVLRDYVTAQRARG